MRFGKKLLAAIERGEWVRMRSWLNGLKIRKGDEGFFVDVTGCAVVLDATEVLAKDWVIVRKKAKAPKAPVAPVAPKAPKADDPRYEPIETMPVVGDKVAHPNDGGLVVLATVERILEVGDTRRWRVEAGGATCSLFKDGCGWRILKRRNVFTDPKLGDVIGRDHLTMEVVKFVDAEAVMFRWNSGSFCAVGRETWATYAANWTVRKLGA